MTGTLETTNNLMASMVAETVNKTDDQIKAALLAEIRSIASGMARLACLVAVCDQRGIDLSDLRLPILGSLRAVAAGRLMPEALQKFGTQRRVIGHLQALPVADQKRIVETGAVAVYVPNDAGETDARMVPVSDLSAALVKQVFASGSVRSPEQQRAYLAAVTPPVKKTTAPEWGQCYRRHVALLKEADETSNHRERQLKLKKAADEFARLQALAN